MGTVISCVQTVARVTSHPKIPKSQSPCWLDETITITSYINMNHFTQGVELNTFILKEYKKIRITKSLYFSSLISTLNSNFKTYNKETNKRNIP